MQSIFLQIYNNKTIICRVLCGYWSQIKLEAHMMSLYTSPGEEIIFLQLQKSQN